MRLNQALLILLIMAGATACQNDNTGDDGALPAEGSTQTEAATSATARLQNAAGEPVGTATFTQTPEGVLVRAELNSLPPGPHALHIHENGVCEPPEFTSAGEHFSPESKEHGFDNPSGPHAGDLPNLDAAEDGKAALETLNRHTSLEEGAMNSLLKAGGTALVVHAGADDYQTNPAGESGDRIACGVIVRDQSGGAD
jgi:Cu-Zn family superoxide dismutase